MSGSESEASLSIGAMVGGTGADARRWRDAIMELSRRVQSLGESVTSPLNVNVVYQIPGEVLPVLEVSGVRCGRPRKRCQALHGLAGERIFEGSHHDTDRCASAVSRAVTRSPLEIVRARSAPLP
jgi:hypothetical protein